MHQELKSKASRLDKERGSVIAYTVLSMLFLFLATGLGVDLSHLYLVKTELQNAADSAALAGASALADPDDDRITIATDRAVSVLNQNRYNFDNKAFVEGQNPDLSDLRQYVRFAVNLSEFDNGGTGMSEADAMADPGDIRFVRVVTPSVPVNIIFAIPIFRARSVASGKPYPPELSARAVSGLSVPGNVSVCIAPLSAIQCNPGDANCDLGPNFRGICPGANPHAPQPVPSPCPVGQPCGPDPDKDGFCDPTKEFCEGCKYTIRSEPAQGPSPGNYQILACAGNGGSVVRQSLAEYNNCKCGLKSVGDEIEVPTQPGVQTGPVEQGLNVRFDVYGGGGLSYSTDIPPDANIEQGTRSGRGANTTWTGIDWSQYKSGSPFTAPAQAHPGVTNRRVLIIPIIAIGEFDNGRDSVNISGLAGFFMRHQVRGNGDINVEFIGDDIKGVIGFDPNDTSITNIVTPVLYR